MKEVLFGLLITLISATVLFNERFTVPERALTTTALIITIELGRQLEEPPDTTQGESQ